MADKTALSRRRREPRSDDDVAEAVTRMVRALAARVGTADPDALRLLKLVQDEMDGAWAAAIAGLREAGFSDTMIGRELGVTRQAVRQRWPRPLDQPHPGEPP